MALSLRTEIPNICAFSFCNSTCKAVSDFTAPGQAAWPKICRLYRCLLKVNVKVSQKEKHPFSPTTLQTLQSVNYRS